LAIIQVLKQISSIFVGRKTLLPLFLHLTLIKVNVPPFRDEIRGILELINPNPSKILGEGMVFMAIEYLYVLISAAGGFVTIDFIFFQFFSHFAKLVKY
jgi:hypothetical protein